MRNAKRFCNFAQVTANAILVLHHRRPADHLQVGNLGQVTQNLVLHAIGEVRVLFIIA